jgi:immune inhibitor A
LGGYGISGGFTYGWNNCSKPVDMAIPQHEFMHGFGLVDLYDQDTTDPYVGIAGIGSYDIMCNAYGWTNDGAYPPYVSPYSKVEAGWLQPINISKPGYYTLQPSELSSQIYIIQANYPQGEYLLLENRYGLLWDQKFSGKGIVIYHIDEAAPLQQHRGYPGHPDWPAWHYRVAVQQADGLYQIEKGVNLGDAGDFYVQGSVLGPDPNTWPNTDSYQNGQVATGITISITTAASYIMQIHVTW